MASVQITGSPSSFNLKSTWICNASGHITSGPTTATKTVSFAVSIPSGSNITSAYVHSEWGSPKGGFAIRSCNGTRVPSDTGNVSVPVGTTNGTVSYEFKFKSNGVSGQGGGRASGITRVSNIYLHIDYTLPYTNPTAPTSVTISPTTAAPGGSATLSWSGASAGNSNPITGYDIYICDGDPNGTYSYYKNVKSTSTSDSSTVDGPTTNNAVRYFKVITLGTVSDYPWSALSSSYASLTCSYSAPSAPKNVRISKCISTGENATLTWDAGSAGTNNPIAGYHIYYRDSSDGINWGNETLYADAGNVTSYSVSPPAVGYYRKYIVYSIGTVSGSNSSGTVCYGSVYYYNGEFTDDPLVSGETRIKAVHMTELQELAGIICTCYDYFDISFDSITAGVTSIGKWSQHVNEIRQAIDDLGISHENWIEISENRPTAEVMQQLRDVLLSA